VERKSVLVCDRCNAAFDWTTLGPTIWNWRAIECQEEVLECIKVERHATASAAPKHHGPNLHRVNADRLQWAFKFIKRHITTAIHVQIVEFSAQSLSTLLGHGHTWTFRARTRSQP
jgi:hypothetical protein